MQLDESVRITIWDDPISEVKSEYGTITYARWLAEEQERMRGHGIETTIEKNDQFMIALFRAPEQKKMKKQ